MIKDIIESAYDHGADMIVTPCPVCQMNVEVYQDQINAKYGTKFKMPTVLLQYADERCLRKSRQGSSGWMARLSRPSSLKRLPESS